LLPTGILQPPKVCCPRSNNPSWASLSLHQRDNRGPPTQLSSNASRTALAKISLRQSNRNLARFPFAILPGCHYLCHSLCCTKSVLCSFIAPLRRINGHIAANSFHLLGCFVYTRVHLIVHLLASFEVADIMPQALLSCQFTLDTTASLSLFLPSKKLPTRSTAGCDMALPEANSGVLSVYLRNFPCLADGSVGPTTCVRDHLLRCQLAKNLSLPCRTWLLLEADWLPTRLTAIDGLRVVKTRGSSHESCSAC
jgi:hypothetical protein